MAKQYDTEDILASAFADVKIDEMEVETDGEQFEVGRISDHQINRGEWSFLVHWKGRNTGSEWVKDSDCMCEGKIGEYLKTVGVKTIFVFCRVSSKNQAGYNHVSLPAQSRRLLREARTRYGGMSKSRVKSVEVVGSAYQGIPARLQQIGKAANAGDVIMVYRADRLSRNIVRYLSWLEELNDRGVEIYAQDDNLWYHNQRLDFIQAVLNAHKESEVIGRRVRMSIQERRERGDEVIGGIPYGSMFHRHGSGRLVVVPNPAEQAVIARVKRLRNTEAEMADKLNSEGNRKRGRKWNVGMVRRLRQD